MLAKQSTALTMIVGPIIDSTGAEYASAVIGDLSLSKNGGTLTALAAAATLTYIANGYYTLVLTTGNTDTLGAIQITCNKSTYQMPKQERNIVPASVYDAIVTNATNAAGGLLAATGSVAAITGTLANTTNITAGTITTVTNLTNAPTAGDLTATMKASVSTSVWSAATRSLTTFGTLASDVWAVATRTLTAASDSSGITTLLTRIVGTLATGTHNPQSGDSFSRLGAPTGVSISADIQTRLATSGYTAPLDAAGVRTAVGLAAPNLDTQLDAIPTNAELATALGTADDATLLAIAAEAVKTAAIKAKTDLIPTDPADASDIAAAFSTVNSTLATISGLIDTEIASIKAKTDGLPADTVASFTALSALVDTLETELAKVIKTGEQVTRVRAGKSNITETVSRG